MERYLFWRTVLILPLILLFSDCLTTSESDTVKLISGENRTITTLQFVTNTPGEQTDSEINSNDHTNDTALNLDYSAAVTDLSDDQGPAEQALSNLSDSEITTENNTYNTTADRLAHLDIMINDEVQFEIDYFLNEKRDFFQGSVNRAVAWLPEIRSMLKEAGLPQELAWLPLIESGFRSEAHSYMGAGGMWQFMPGTARYCGLTMKTGYDERLDPVIAGKAAIEFLKYLYGHFDDWNLTLAAYNLGGRNVKKALAKSESRDFFSLVRNKLIPGETRRYVPRFLATCHIIQNATQYGITIPKSVTDHDYVAIKFSPPLSLVSHYAAVNTSTIKRLNPAITSILVPKIKNGYRLRIPYKSVEKLKQNMAHLKQATRNAYDRYCIKKNEALSQIAAAHNISTADLANINEITNTNRIWEGQMLYVPRIKKKSTPALGSTIKYRVKSGDTISDIALQYGVSTDNIIRDNNLNDPSKIGVGLILTIVTD